MTPSGRKAIVAAGVIVFAGGAILLKGFLDLGSHTEKRHRHRAEPPGGPGSKLERAFAPREPPKIEPPRSPAQEWAAPPVARSNGEAEWPGSSIPGPAEQPGNDFVLAPKTPENEAQQRTVQQTMEGAVFRNPGSEVAYVDCAGGPCRARAEARDLEALTAFLRDLSGTYDGHVSVEVREHFDPFMGRTFQADLLVGTKDAESVPTEPTIRETLQ